MPPCTRNTPGSTFFQLDLHFSSKILRCLSKKTVFLFICYYRSAVMFVKRKTSLILSLCLSMSLFSRPQRKIQFERPGRESPVGGSYSTTFACAMRPVFLLLLLLNAASADGRPEYASSAAVPPRGVSPGAVAPPCGAARAARSRQALSQHRRGISSKSEGWLASALLAVRGGADEIGAAAAAADGEDRDKSSRAGGGDGRSPGSKKVDDNVPVLGEQPAATEHHAMDMSEGEPCPVAEIDDNAVAQIFGTSVGHDDRLCRVLRCALPPGAPL